MKENIQFGIIFVIVLLIFGIVIGAAYRGTLKRTEKFIAVCVELQVPASTCKVLESLK